MPDNLETTFFLAEHFVAAYSAKRATLSVVQTVTASALVYYSCKGKQSGRPFWYRGYRSGLCVAKFKLQFYPQQGVFSGFTHLTFK